MRHILFALLLVGSAFGQSKKEQYWNWTEQTLVAGSLAADGFSTQRFEGQGFRELNPIAKPFVQSRPGTVAYFSFAEGLSLTANHLLVHHTKIRHVMNWTTIGVETYWAVHNFQLNRR